MYNVAQYHCSPSVQVQRQCDCSGVLPIAREYDVHGVLELKDRMLHLARVEDSPTSTVRVTPPREISCTVGRISADRNDVDTFQAVDVTHG
jgi:hypothetical protein